MSLEDAVTENTTAVKALTAIMAGKPAAAPAAADGKRGPGRPPAAKKVTLAEVKAMAYKVRDERDSPTAVQLIKEHGADSLAELDESKYAAFIAAAEVLLNQEPDAGGGADAEL